MRTEVIYELKSGYRVPLQVKSYQFGSEEKTVCIVGAIRGNEVQQLYICSQIIRTLKELEEQGKFAKKRGVTVIPSVNHYSMNIGKRFWAMDNSDINRMFPGYDKGETTQRIAAGVFEKLQGYKIGIQFGSFYIPGNFMPHVRMIDTSYQKTELASLFGLPFSVVRTPTPYDTTLLNYNWQVWNTSAFSIYTEATDSIDEQGAQRAVMSVLRFLSRMGIIRINVHGGYDTTNFNESDLEILRASKGGIYRPLKKAGENVLEGETMGLILHPYEGTVIEEVCAKQDGIVFFAGNYPLVMQHTILFKVIPGLML